MLGEQDPEGTGHRDEKRGPAISWDHWLVRGQTKTTEFIEKVPL